jgi:GntR family transcriptional repressor for pyruvate dehydrogenase complex
MPKKGPAVFRNLDSGRNGSTAEEVAARLRDMIHSGELAAGDRLPPERDLAKILGVSRPTIAGRESDPYLRRYIAVEARRGNIRCRARRIADAGQLRRFACCLRFMVSRPTRCSKPRLALEMSIAGPGSRRANSEHMTRLAEEIAGMYASLNDP